MTPSVYIDNSDACTSSRKYCMEHIIFGTQSLNCVQIQRIAMKIWILSCESYQT